uniref:Cation-transporting ATPase n=1 Tax=Labrus bergylta TaxID=56723 RepID=A0A3Q3FEB5_9LABR
PDRMKTREPKIINQGLEDEMEVWGYQPCLWKMVLVGMGAVCSGGLLLLLLYWLPEWGVKGTCTYTSLRDARTLLLRTTV